MEIANPNWKMIGDIFGQNNNTQPHLSVDDYSNLYKTMGIIMSTCDFGLVTFNSIINTKNVHICVLTQRNIGFRPILSKP